MSWIVWTTKEFNETIITVRQLKKLKCSDCGKVKLGFHIWCIFHINHFKNGTLINDNQVSKVFRRKEDAEEYAKVSEVVSQL